MVANPLIRRFSVHLVRLDPAVGAEVRKTRPCLVISPTEMHRHLRTVLVAPLTSSRTGYPTRVPCTFAGHTGEVMLDQIKAVDRSRIIRELGAFDGASASRVLQALATMFS